MLPAPSAFSKAPPPEATDRARRRTGDAGNGAARPQRVYGSARFHTSANKTAFARMSEQRLLSPASAHASRRPMVPAPALAEPARLPLLCESRDGYQNLCQLITQFKMRETHQAKASATSGPQQYASRPGLPDRWRRRPTRRCLIAVAKKPAAKPSSGWCSIFGTQNVYVELQRHMSAKKSGAIRLQYASQSL